MNPEFFRLPISLLALPEFLGNLSVEFVQVGSIHAGVKGREFTLKARTFIGRILAHLDMCTLQGFGDAPHNIFRDGHIPEHVPHSLCDFLLTKSG
ncbi:MAG: hypothetical protein ACLPY1_22010 [Terracidiphilus sp.]